VSLSLSGFSGKNTMPKIRALEFADNRTGSQLLPVYALVGDDPYLLHICRQDIIQGVERNDAPAGMCRIFSGSAPGREVFEELRTLPFMAMEGLRGAIVEDADEFVRQNKESLEAYLDRPARTAVLVLCCHDLDGRTKVTRLILKKGMLVDCSPLTWSETARWIGARAARLGRKLTPRAGSLLLEAVGADLFALENELDKLAAYCADETVVSERAVTELVAQSRTRSVFELGNAIASKDVGEALRLSRRLLLRGESLPGLIAVLGRGVRRLWQIRRMHSSGASVAEIHTALRMPEFAVKRSLNLLGGVTEQWLARSLSLLAQADHECKSTAIQRREEDVWLERLLASLCR